jgi:protein O-GlcNAc transferase
MTMPAARNLDQARAHQRAGRLGQAESLCRQALADEPGHADALGLLGLVLAGQGKTAEAAEAFAGAAAARPEEFTFHLNLGTALCGSGRLEAGIEAFRRAQALRPTSAQALYNLGRALLDADRPGEAVDALQRAVALEPKLAIAHHNRGIALGRVGRIDEAIEAYRQATVARPDFVDAFLSLGNALQSRGRPDEALIACRRAAELRPDLAEVQNNLAGALRETGQVDEALAAYRRALQLRPDYAEALCNAGVTLAAAGRMDEAMIGCSRAVELAPANAEMHNSLGNIHKDQGRAEKAVACYRRAIELDATDAAAHSNVIYGMHLVPGIGADQILVEAREWNRLHAAPLRAMIRPFGNEASPDRRLRIGLISADLSRHVVGWNLLPLLRNRDRLVIELYLYSSGSRPDSVTALLRDTADGGCDIVGLPDEAAAELIRRDGIDVLIELSVHTRGNRLPLLARKPAPVQATYLGYCGTTGVETIDYRFSDSYFDPPDADLSCYSERTVRLSSYWCYLPPGPTAEPGGQPADSAGMVTFGSLNNFAKASPAALELWAKVLASVPGSRLLLRANPGKHLEDVRGYFTRTGVAADRIEFVGRRSWHDYLRSYDRIDVALDPLPYGGGMTTCDALWMGVPVVTLPGRTAIGRGGVSILGTLGLTELVAESPQKYVEIAAALAGDVARLRQLRRELRPRMQASPLLDGRRFAADIEAACRTMWRHWCASGGR